MPQDTIESRLEALERAVGNPHRVTQGDVVSLKEYFEVRLAAIEKATEIALAATDVRLVGMNEIRGTLKDQAVHLVTRAEVNLQFDAIREQLKGLEKHQNIAEGKASMSMVYISYAISAIGIALGIFSLIR